MPRPRQFIYASTLAAGAALGAAFGDLPFPELEELIGDPLCDIIMAVGGAAIAGVGYEIVSSLFPRWI